MLSTYLTAFFATLASLGASASASCLHGTDLEPRQYFNKRSGEKVVKVANFGYTGLQGPLNWAGLSSANTECNRGKNQSPINIVSSKVEKLKAGTMKLQIPTVTAELENLGATVEVVMEGKNATLTVEGKTYSLKQFHFHTPSEHRINEEYFPLEMHSMNHFSLCYQYSNADIATVVHQSTS